MEIITRPNSLITRLFKAKCFPKSTFLDSGIIQVTSSIAFGVPSSVCVQATGGVLVLVIVSVWNDIWLHNGSIIMQTPLLNPELVDITVADLLQANRKVWDSGIVIGLLGQDAASPVLQTPIQFCPKQSHYLEA